VGWHRVGGLLLREAAHALPAGCVRGQVNETAVFTQRAVDVLSPH
jgi:hypothetical protein